MKRHNLFKVVMITVFVAALLSWIFPVTYLSSNSGQLVEEARDQVGAFDLMTYLGVAIQYFSHVAIYILTIGGFYGLVFKLPAYRNLIDKMVKVFDGKEWLFVGIIIVLFGVGSAIAGLSLPVLFFFPFVIAVLLALGYDRITAALVTAGSTVVGLIGSVFNVNNTYGFDMVLGTKPGDNWKFKGLLLLICLAILFGYTIYYASKHKGSKKEEKLFVPKPTQYKREKIWPIVVVIDGLFVLLALAFMPWSTFGVTAFTDLHDKLSKFAIGGFPILEKLFGLGNAFGSWTLVEGSVVIILASILVAFVYKVRLNDFVSAFMDGCERALKPAVLVILMYTVLVTATYVPTLLAICKPILGSKIGVIQSGISVFIYSVFSVESYYVGSGLLPYLETLTASGFSAAQQAGLAIVSQGFYGLAMLIAPTSVVVMATLAYLNIPYHKWLKNVCILFAILMVVVVIFAMIKM